MCNRFGLTFYSQSSGSVRLYHSDSPMVLKAVRGIGSEIESLALAHRTGADNDDVMDSDRTKKYAMPICKSSGYL